MYKQYEKYKDSGVEWIGEIPNNWTVGKLKNYTTCLDGKRVPLSSEERGKMKGDYPYWGANCIIDYVNNWLFDGEVIILGEDGAPFFDWFKPVAFYSNTKIWVNNHAHILKPNKNNDAKLLTYFLNIVNYKNYIKGSTRDKLTQAEMNKIPVVYFPNSEQKSIVNFLEQKTSQIDSLIADKEELIKKLEEYKQSIITEAVTKGLNPDVKMKGSGIEWIGEIPEHWDVKKIAWLFGLISSGATPESSTLNYYNDGDIPWLNTGELNDGLIYETKKHITEIAVKKYSALKIYPPNVLVIAMYGATIGKLGITKISLSANQACCVLSKQRGIDIEFMFYWFLAKRKQIISMAYGGGQPNISQTLISSLRVGVPKKTEQKEIVIIIQEKVKEADKLIKDLDKHILLLNSYRQSLIFEAVTGKIDVRDYQSERSEQFA